MSSETPSADSISNRERWKAYLVVSLIVFPTLACIASGREYWPYSNFSMYSRSLTTPICRQYHLVVVGESGKEIVTADTSLLPMSPAGFAILINKLLQEENGKEKIHQIMRVIATQYESQSANQLPAGSKNQLQLVEYEWKMQPQAKNYDQPDSVTVLSEIEIFGAPSK